MLTVVPETSVVCALTNPGNIKAKAAKVVKYLINCEERLAQIRTGFTAFPAMFGAPDAAWLWPIIIPLFSLYSEILAM
jgi:hypothetical protein